MDADLVIQGAGTRTTAGFYQKAAFAYRVVKQSVSVQYTPLSSGRSTCRLMDHARRCQATDTTAPLHIDFAASDSPLKAVDYAEYPDLQMYPTVALAAVPIYNLGIDVQLILTQRALAQIFSGEIQVSRLSVWL